MKNTIVSISIMAVTSISCGRKEQADHILQRTTSELELMKNRMNEHRVIVRGTVSGRRDEEIIEAQHSTVGDQSSTYYTKDIIHIHVNGRHHLGRSHAYPILKEIKNGDDISGVLNTRTNTLELVVDHTTGKKYFHLGYIGYFLRLALLVAVNRLFYMVAFQKLGYAAIAGKFGDIAIYFPFAVAGLGGLSILVVTPYFLYVHTYSLIVSDFYRANFMH